MARKKQRRGLVEGPSTSGWATLYDAAREVDINKLSEMKQDLDRLPTVAGLYSGVITAFLIESYKHLQQDPEDVIASLLQQRIAQNFTSGPGFLNSTAPPPLPPFEPPNWAIRVNILWSTSLVLSLTTASFGLVVNDWLREFLQVDFEFTAPQYRLRARHYRSPTLFWIELPNVAAWLPLYLQIALGCFFWGLCIFTASIQTGSLQSVTSVVCGWLFIILSTAVAPMISPRSPTKITAIKQFIETTRRYSIPPLCHLLRHISTRFGKPIATSWIEYEEKDAVMTKAEDMKIVLAIDARLQDDSLLPAMLNALAETMPEALVAFILEIIENRTKQHLDQNPLAFIPDLVSLSEYAWYTLTDTMVDALQQLNASPLTVNTTNRDWICRYIVILWHSPSPYALSRHATKTLQEILVVPPQTDDHAHSHSIYLHQILGRARTASPGTSADPDIADTNTQCLRCVTDTYTSLLCQDCTHSSLRHLLDTHIPSSLTTPSKRLLQNMYDVVVPFLRWIISSEKNWEEVPGSHEAFHIVLQHSEELERRDDVVALCRQMLLTTLGTRSILAQFAALHPQGRLSGDCGEIIWKCFEDASTEDRDQMQSNLKSELKQFCSGVEEEVPLDYVRLCTLWTWTTETQLEHAIAEAIEKYHRVQGWQKDYQSLYWHRDSESPTSSEELLVEDQALACACFETLISTSLVRTSTRIFDALWLFVPEERKGTILPSIIARWGYTPRSHSGRRKGDVSGRADTRLAATWRIPRAGNISGGRGDEEQPSWRGSE